VKNLFDRSFEYTRSTETDVRKTFERVRRQLQEQERARALAETESQPKLSPITRAKSAVSA
jgi:hypothetical protein